MSVPAIKAVALDVDGTLLDSKHEVPDAVKNALSDLVANDVFVILATARGPKILGAVLRLLPISPLLVCFSGAWIGEIDRESLIPRKEILNRRHNMDAARFIVEKALELNVEPNVLTVDTWRVRKMTPEILRESQIAECNPLITSDLLPDGDQPNKILLITPTDDSNLPLQTIADSVRSISSAGVLQAELSRDRSAWSSQGRGFATPHCVPRSRPVASRRNRRWTERYRDAYRSGFGYRNGERA